MRFERFCALMTEVFNANPDPAIKQILTTEECGYNALAQQERRGGGWRIEFVTGAQLFLQFVGSYPPGGDDHSKPERIVEAESALAPVPVPPIQVEGGRVQVASVRRWLVAAITNSGSREITEVNVPGDIDGAPYGAVNVRFANGGSKSGLFVHALRPGQRPNPNAQYKDIAAVV